MDDRYREVRANVRNFLLTATLDQLKRELEISLERQDVLRAKAVQELIDEHCGLLRM